MRHGEQIIVITTTKDAESVLEHLSQCEKSAKENNYANERKKPIKWMECCCCGESYQGRQWFNQDSGYGLGDCCVSYCNVDSAPGSESSSYGVSGIHFLISQEEKDNPPLIVDRGVPLYGLDERLRIEHDGFVFWKGIEIEHFSGSLLYDSDESKAQAFDLIKRCETIESRGETVNTRSVIWNWKDDSQLIPSDGFADGGCEYTDEELNS